MKKINFLLVVLVGIFAFASCSDNDSYADQIERERNAMNDFIVKKGIKVISEQQFQAQDSTTDVSKNEYVKFDNAGVYMQIVHKGVGEKIKKGESTTVLCRFSEYNIFTDTLQLTNNSLYWSSVVDKMSVTNTSGTFTASFDPSSSVMYRAYQSASVPKGWLVALPYVNIGRIQNATDSLAHVKLIVPSTHGQKLASQNVYPCFYDITFGRGV
ncbi:DUF4827 domain-containing protein [Prevotella sp. HUN102]|uniref:DUF4827 domain-containing protein n=1 Tax=Prevotella sp. HUN102 TaxID=1392486 RepID=UPI00048B036D|nr:DUF4827 domain-containing protein [Prevotella sp. HUN102]